jgi:hypothetical protein
MAYFRSVYAPSQNCLLGILSIAKALPQSKPNIEPLKRD